MIAHTKNNSNKKKLINLYKTLKQIAFKHKNKNTTLTYLKKTITLQPNNPKTLKNLIKLCTAQKHWQKMINYTNELRNLLADPLKKFDLQLHINNTYLNQLTKTDKTIFTYQTTLDYQPESKTAHFRIFQILNDTEHYNKTIEILNQLVELKNNNKHKTKYLNTIDNIFQKKLIDNKRTVKFYNRTLDHDPSLLKIFQTIDKILTKTQN